MPRYDLIIVGAGPAGLATAIAAKQAGLDFRLFEKGVLVNALFHFPGQMVFFTTPELLEIGGLPFVTSRDKSTRDEALRYYRRVVDTFELDIAFGHTATELTTDRVDGFTLTTRDREGRPERWQSRTVVMATGCYDHPNLLGIPGEDLPHVSHYYSEPHPFYRKRVVIVGAKNSAAAAALDLYRAGADVTLVHRGDALASSIKYWVRPDIENRIKEGSIRARFDTRVVEIRPTEVVVEPVRPAGQRSAFRERLFGSSDEPAREVVPADAVFLLTGYLADLEFLRACGVAVDPGTGVPQHDPETFETNVPGLYLAGAVVVGANRGEVFIENGRFHGQVVVREIARRVAG